MLILGDKLHLELVGWSLHFSKLHFPTCKVESLWEPIHLQNTGSKKPIPERRTKGLKIWMRSCKTEMQLMPLQWVALSTIQRILRPLYPLFIHRNIFVCSFDCPQLNCPTAKVILPFAGSVECLTTLPPLNQARWPKQKCADKLRPRVCKAGWRDLPPATSWIQATPRKQNLQEASYK